MIARLSGFNVNVEFHVNGASKYVDCFTLKLARPTVSWACDRQPVRLSWAPTHMTHSARNTLFESITCFARRTGVLAGGFAMVWSAAATPALATPTTTSLIHVWTTQAASAAAFQNSVIVGVPGILGGMLLSLALLTALLWISQRTGVYLLNLLMTSGLLLSLVAVTDPGDPALSAARGELPVAVGYSVFGIAGALLCRRFLETETRRSPLDKLFMAIALGFLVIPTLPLLLPDLPVRLPIAGLNGVLALSASLAILLQWSQRPGGLTAFQTGWLLVLAASSIEIARNFNLLPLNTFTAHAPQVAHVAAMIALTAALSCATHAYERTRRHNLNRELAAQTQRIEELQRTEQMLVHQISQRNHELEKANRELQDHRDGKGLNGQHDPLTGLANRALLEDRINHGMVRSIRHNARLAIIVADIDDFKTINSRFGRDFGDELLTAIARRLNGISRAEDTVARLGSDDFAILLEDVFDSDDIQRALTAVSTELTKPFKIREHKLNVSASLGHAFFPDNGKNAEHLIKSADRMMYLARTCGEAPASTESGTDGPTGPQA